MASLSSPTNNSTLTGASLSSTSATATAATEDGDVKPLEHVPKRAKIRARPAAIPAAAAIPDPPAPAPAPPAILPLLLAEPELPPGGFPNAFNVSEVIKGFLYVGAGFDAHGRMVTSLPSSAGAEEEQERVKWWRDRNVRFALNMAGSPLQHELRGVSYPTAMVPEEAWLAVDVNDVEKWQGSSMRQAFHRGASFIQQAYDQFLVQEGGGGGGGIFVHCVAGVNRSPFVVVWWLVKFHNMHPQFAYDLVRARRDVGAAWHDETLGGPLLHPSKPEKSRRKWFDAMLKDADDDESSSS